jgi:hypothetical protein
MLVDVNISLSNVTTTLPALADFFIELCSSASLQTCSVYSPYKAFLTFQRIGSAHQLANFDLTFAALPAIADLFGDLGIH